MHEELERILREGGGPADITRLIRRMSRRRRAVRWLRRTFTRSKCGCSCRSCRTYCGACTRWCEQYG